MFILYGLLVVKAMAEDAIMSLLARRRKVDAEYDARMADWLERQAKN
jgi:hypothetical protein